MCKQYVYEIDLCDAYEIDIFNIDLYEIYVNIFKKYLRKYKNTIPVFNKKLDIVNILWIYMIYHINEIENMIL